MSNTMDKMKEMGNTSVGAGHVGTMYAILTSNARIAREASLTGTLEDSTRALVSAYNRVVKVLREMGCFDELLFEEATADATMDDIGVMSEHLSKFLQRKWGCGIEDREEGNQDTLAELLQKLLVDHKKETEGQE